MLSLTLFSLVWRKCDQYVIKGLSECKLVFAKVVHMHMKLENNASE